MSKKKKASPKQTKQNVQKPQAKAGKDDSAPQKAAPEAVKKKETQTKAAPPPTTPAKEKSKSKPDIAAPAAPKAEIKPEPKAEAKAETKTEGKVAPKAEKVAAKPEAKKAGQADKQVPAKGKGKKKNKAGKQAVAAEEIEEVIDQEPAVEEAVEQKAADQESENIDKTVEISTPAAAETATSDSVTRKVAKTLIDEEIDATPGREISEGDEQVVELDQGEDAPVEPGDAPRKVAKTMLEVNISGLAEAAAKATGTHKTPPQGSDRKVAKTILEMDTTGLRDSVEASSRAIEDEIAAAIKEAETAESAESVEAAESFEPTESVQDSHPEPSDSKQKVNKISSERPIARTLLDVRAEDLFELVASMEAQEDSETETEQSSPEGSDSEKKIESAPEPIKTDASPPAQPRKVARTMLESDSPDIGKLIAEANAASQNTAPVQQKSPTAEHTSPAVEQDVPAVEPEPVRRQGTDEVSMADLSEFAQALKEDKPMSPPSPRVEKLRKTMMNIRKHGLETSSSYPSVKAPRESIEASSMQSAQEAPAAPEFNLDAKQAPLRVSRSLHTIETLEQPSAGPDEVIDRTVEAPLPDFEGDANSLTKRTGTVEMSVNPHDDFAPEAHEHTPARVTDEGFKGVTTVWPHDQEQQDGEKRTGEGTQPGQRKPERFVARTMLDMDFLKDSLSASVQRAEEKMAESIAQKMSEPPKQVLTQDDYKLAQTGCPFVWTENPDNPKERVKYCTECSLQVYNFSGFDMAEAQSLIFKRENRNNAPLYKREDGKFMTADCPIASKKKKDNQMLIGGAVLVLVLLVIMVVASFLSPQPPPAPPATSDQPSGVSATPDTSPSANTKTGGQSANTGSSTGGDESARPGAYHYVRGKGVIQQKPIIVKPQEPVDNTIPGTTSGFDEGGQFWQYTDKGNN